MEDPPCLGESWDFPSFSHVLHVWEILGVFPPLLIQVWEILEIFPPLLTQVRRSSGSSLLLSQSRILEVVPTPLTQVPSGPNTGNPEDQALQSVPVQEPKDPH
jgi:hypothetical protein